MMSNRSNFTCRALRVAALQAVAVLTVGVSVSLPVSQASAQVQAVEPYWATVQTDKAPVRCYFTDTSYSVSELPKGFVVRVDAEGSLYSRIVYPAKMTAFVQGEHGKVEGGVVKLTQASRLRAASTLAGFDGSWKALLDTPLPVGTELKFIENVTNKEGTVIAYRVQAPEAARGYVPTSALRKATDAEAAAAGNQVAPATAKPETKKPDAPAGGTGTPAANPPATTDLTQPMQPTGQAPTTTPGATPVITPGTTPAGGVSPLTTPGTVPTTDVTATPPQGAASTVPGTPSERKVGTLEDLEATFQRVAKQPAAEAEYDELIAELQRASDAQGPEMTRRKKQIESRKEFLSIRRDYRDRVRAAEEAKRQLDANELQVKNSIAEIEKSRVYTIIGTLQPSTVYDGQRLPLMYRVQSVGGLSPRTLGYIKPDAKFDLDHKLGLVVGVIGNSEMDRELKLNIVTPVRVDVLRPGQAFQPVQTPGTGVQVPVTEIVQPKGAAPATTPASTEGEKPQNPQ